jgi:hypothetical protein
MTGMRLAFDSSPLNYFARSGQLLTLGKLVQGSSCLITRAVEDELLRGATKHAQLYQASAQSWITVVEDSSIEFLKLFSEYHSRLGGGGAILVNPRLWPMPNCTGWSLSLTIA